MAPLVLVLCKVAATCSDLDLDSRIDNRQSVPQHDGLRSLICHSSKGSVPDLATAPPVAIILVAGPQPATTTDKWRVILFCTSIVVIGIIRSTFVSISVLIRCAIKSAKIDGRSINCRVISIGIIAMLKNVRGSSHWRSDLNESWPKHTQKRD